MTSKERVDRALRGEDVDRPPFTLWHHFGLQKEPGERHARATLEFHRKFRTDLVKVMSDYPFPKPAGNWYDVKVQDNPYPQQLRALEVIREGLKGEAYFIETIFNPWNVAEKLSSKEEVQRLKRENPQALLEALQGIAESEAHHAKKALAAGASGVFLAVANAQEGILTREEYEKFSAPFDRLVLQAVSGAKLNVLHAHGDKVYLDLFYQGFGFTVFNYSAHTTGVPVADVRAGYAGVIMGGVDEVNYRKLSEGEIRSQAEAAGKAAGKKFILAPGCSVPDDSSDAELGRMFAAVRGR
ncbi:MAG: uroporphyrinogen decarboxylase family protein [Bryobacteraceae bacterium]